MDVCGRGDEQVRHACPRLPARSGNVRRELAVAVSHSIVDGTWIKPPLQSAQTREPDGPDLRRRRDEHTELERRLLKL